jgi:hypothetical protein
MPTGTIQALVCIKSASGVDIGVFHAFAQLPTPILPSGIDATINILKASPGVIEAIDAARADPDNLYVTLQTGADRDRAIWPGPGQDVDMLPGQSARVGISVDFEFSQNVSLFDYDTVGSDDHLGSVTILADEQGQGDIAKLASSIVEGSAYYVIYRVD